MTPTSLRPVAINLATARTEFCFDVIYPGSDGVVAIVTIDDRTVLVPVDAGVPCKVSGRAVLGAAGGTTATSLTVG